MSDKKPEDMTQKELVDSLKEDFANVVNERNHLRSCIKKQVAKNGALLKALHDYHKEAEATIAAIRDQSQVNLNDKIKLQIKNAKLSEAIGDYRAFSEAMILELKTKVKIRDQQIKNISNN